MFRYLVFSAAASMLLIGCQTSNPYQAESLPLPPAPAAAATHFDTSAYPATVTKKTYTYWCWRDQAPGQTSTSHAQGTARYILAEQLEQHALRPALSAEQCQLKVQLSSQHIQRVRHDYDNYPSAHYGYGYGRGHPYHDRYRHSGIGVDFPITPRSYIEYFQQLTLTFTDAQTGESVWSAQSNAASDRNAATSEQGLRDAINKMLKAYN